MTSARETLENWFDRVWNGGDASGIDELYKPGKQSKNFSAYAMVDPEDYKDFHKLLNTLLADLHISIDHFISDGEWSSALCTVTGKGRESGKPVLMTGNVYFKLEDNILVEGYDNFNFMGLYAQLGLVPEDINERCLSGQSALAAGMRSIGQ